MPSRNRKFFAAPADNVVVAPTVEAFRESVTHRYKITHLTPRVTDGGTDEWVHIHLRGPQGEFTRLPDIPHPYNDREQGQTDSYIIDGPEIRPITAVGFRMVRDTNDGNWRRRCGKVHVEDLTTGYSVYIEDFGWVDQFDHIFWRST